MKVKFEERTLINSDPDQYETKEHTGTLISVSNGLFGGVAFVACSDNKIRKAKIESIDIIND